MAIIGNGAAEGGAGAVSSVAVVSAAVEGSTTEVTTVSIESGSVMTTTEVTTVTVKNTQEEVSAAAAPATLPVTMAEPVTMGEGKTLILKNINPFMPDIYLKSVVWTYHSFKNNFGMKHILKKNICRRFVDKVLMNNFASHISGILALVRKISPK